MDSKIWSAPVTLEMFGHGNYRVVTSAKEAAKVLCNEWPYGSGPMYTEALATCAAALKGDADPEQARADFVKAAEEAGITIVYQ